MSYNFKIISTSPGANELTGPGRYGSDFKGDISESISVIHNFDNFFKIALRRMPLGCWDGKSTVVQ